MHWYGFSPVCIFMTFKITFFRNQALSQWIHWNAFSPVCIFICSLKLILSRKACHNDCTGKFSPLYIFILLLRILFCEKNLLYWLHWYHSLTMCILKCFIRSFLNKKASAKRLHWYDVPYHWVFFCFMWCLDLTKL